MAQISVLLPVHNGGDFLTAAVTSILEQTHADLELILVDDHSEDAAITNLPAELADDPRLQIHTNPGRGVSAATNHAAELASSEYLARMDADDLALPQRLETQRNYLQAHPQIDICGTEVEIFTATGKPAGGYARYQDWINQLHRPEDIAENIYIESPIPNPTVMFRRPAFEALGGYRDTLWHEDYDLYLRAHYLGMQFGKPSGIHLRWRDHQQRSTRNQARYTQAQLMNCKAHYLAQHELANRPAIICGGGPVALALHDALLEAGAEIEAFVDVATRRIGGLKRGIPVCSTNHIDANNPALFLAAVGQPGARAKIHHLFNERGLLASKNYWLCA